MHKKDWKRYKKEEKEVIINIDYEDDRITIYTNNSTVGCNLYRRLGEPTVIGRIEGKIADAEWRLPFTEIDIIKKILIVKCFVPYQTVKSKNK